MGPNTILSMFLMPKLHARAGLRACGAAESEKKSVSLTGVRELAVFSRKHQLSPRQAG